MIKLQIGGSPCTYWSIAQHNDRETEAEGLGWELFKNYVVAKEKFKPDFFLYENNKSAAEAIKQQIQHELGEKLMYINSALVSAQNRQRFYVFNWEAEQPADRKIYLRDILETREYYKIPEEANREGLTAIRVGQIDKGSQGDRIYSVEGKAVAMKAQGGGWGAKTGLYAVPVGIGYRNRREEDGKLYRRFETHNEEKANAITTVATDSMVAEPLENYPMAADQDRPGVNQIYEVRDGMVTLKGRKFNIKIADGYYIVRELTCLEAERCQTLPDNYTAGVSTTQRKKGIGNGWTAEVIIHLLTAALKDVPKDEEIVVLSMYDGIGTGRYCLDKMGFKNVKYFAYEIDEPAKKIAMKNWPDIIQMGDAFQVRNEDWKLPI